MATRKSAKNPSHKVVATTSQDYPRIRDPKSKFSGCLDESKVIPHKKKIPEAEMKRLMKRAIERAAVKSRREMLSIPPDATEEETAEIYEKEGKELFKYFKKYPTDPAASAYQMKGKHYRDVGAELFRNRTLQKERMNSGWRYQFLAVDAARASGRFKSVSDIGTAEGDFNAVVGFIDDAYEDLNLYTSVKNRSNTLGGQDWPKAIAALEAVAAVDKNRIGPYLCVFGIAIDRGERYIKREKKTKRAQSDNTEVWQSDFFWPFFTNHTYEEIMQMMLEVLEEDDADTGELPAAINVPDEVLDAFGKKCIDAGLVDRLGRFDNTKKLVSFFCQK
ncbi:MAG: hypothetical protein ABW208_20950 [Pyrinomonadaceae bacterium]